MRLIDADARVTVQSFDVEHEEYDYTEMSVAEALDFVTDEGCPPVVEAAPVVHARAIKQSPFDKQSRYCIWKVSCKCSNCGEYVSDVWNYCPKCMAKLDGGELNDT